MGIIGSAKLAFVLVVAAANSVALASSSVGQQELLQSLTKVRVAKPGDAFTGPHGDITVGTPVEVLLPIPQVSDEQGCHGLGAHWYYDVTSQEFIFSLSSNTFHSTWLVGPDSGLYDKSYIALSCTHKELPRTTAVNVFNVPFPVFNHRFDVLGIAFDRSPLTQDITVRVPSAEARALAPALRLRIVAEIADLGGQNPTACVRLENKTTMNNELDWRASVCVYYVKINRAEVIDGRDGHVVAALSSSTQP